MIEVRCRECRAWVPKSEICPACHLHRCGHGALCDRARDVEERARECDALIDQMDITEDNKRLARAESRRLLWRN